MANVAEDFVSKFHSLEGTTIAERRKNFFMLLHQNSSLRSNAEVLNAIASNLAPKTYLESLFKLEFLIYYRRALDLHQLLKEGNEIFVSKIARQVWFFKESFNEVEVEEFVNETLPCMSFSVRMKVLRMVFRYVDSQRADKIFEAVAARYGIFIAVNFIASCTPTKIRAVLTEYPVKLTVAQLKVLFQKDSDLIKFYFENINNSIGSQFYKHFRGFIFNENKTLFNYLRRKYNFDMQFGRRITKKVVDVERDAIINSPYNYNLLNMKAVIRKIGKDSLRLFCNALPPNMDQVYQIRQFIDFFPKKYHYSLYVKTIEDYYKSKFIEYPQLIDTYLLNLTPESSERAVWAKVKVDEGNDDFIKYLTTQESIPLIKEKINVTSNISERGNLVAYLVDTCHINNDIDALAQVMKYFCLRHKNDEFNVHMQFIFKIENLFGFAKFTEEMWNCLNDLLTIHMLKFDKDFSTYKKIQTLPLIKFNKGTSTQKLSYLEFLFKKNEPIDELILEYLGAEASLPRWGSYSKEFGKYFLLFVINHNCDKPLEKKQIGYNCFLIDEIFSWNGRYKNDQISFYDFPSLVYSFDYSIRNCNVSVGIRNHVKSKIFTTNENSYKNEYLEVYWARLPKFAVYNDFKWFIKYEPLILVKYLTEFVNKMIDMDNLRNELNMWHKIKKFSHLQLDDKLIELCNSKLSDDACLENKPKFVPCLSVLMKPKDFAALAHSYKPASKTLNLNNETEVKLYNLQCAIAENFKHTKSYEVLSSLLDYCAGDYFKYSLGSLYSIMHRTPENMIPQYLNYLATKGVSVRKHALYLTCELSTVTKVEDVLRLLNKTEGVQSLQKYIFSSTIKYFVKNPSDNFFELVKLNILFVNKNDEESHGCIIKTIREIPQKYKALYIQHSWEHLEKVMDRWNKLLPMKESLLAAMNKEIMLQLPLEFASKILEEHFLVLDKCMDIHDMCSFAFSLASCREEKTTILEAVFNILEQRAKRSDAFEFFHSWYKYTMQFKADDLKYLEPFLEYFETKINILDDFDDYVKIFFLKTKLVVPRHDFVDDLCTRIFSFSENLISVHDLYIIETLSKELKAGISYFAINEVTVYDLYHNLITNHPVPNVAALVLHVISRSNKKGMSAIVFKRIIQQIATIPDSGIQISLRSKFKSYLIEQNIFTKALSTTKADIPSIDE